MRRRETRPCLRGSSLEKRKKVLKSLSAFLAPFSYRVWQAPQEEKVSQAPWGHLDHQGQQ